MIQSIDHYQRAQGLDRQVEVFLQYLQGTVNLKRPVQNAL